MTPAKAKRLRKETWAKPLAHLQPLLDAIKANNDFMVGVLRKAEWKRKRKERARRGVHGK